MHTKFTHSPPWPYLTATVPSLAGRIRHDPEDFRVEGIAAYPPSGEGQHLFVQFEKRGLTTPQAVERLARALGVAPRAASWAGMKDRHAVTVQWASFDGATPEAAANLEVEGVRVLTVARHHRKLRTGHLRGNRFRIVVRDVPLERIDEVSQGLDTLQRTGMPNYYEAQRFGHGGRNLDVAVRWLAGNAPPPRDRLQRKWDVSVLQSWLFNQVLADRVTTGALATALPGDVMRREDSGGMFVCESPEAEQERLDRWEISPTGPMFGPKMTWPQHEVLARELRVLEEAGMAPAHIESFGRAGPGTRRPLRVRPTDVRMEPVPEGLVLAFELPAGSYATALLRELFKEGLQVGPQGGWVEPATRSA
jgi:tRNA pseudouridine13 synthase